MSKNFLKLMILFLSLTLMVSCCHNKNPDILQKKYSKIFTHADHPINQESAFFILVNLNVPIYVPEIGGELFAQSTGSGVAVRSGDGWTDVLTAGHVCMPEEPDAVAADKTYTLFLLSGEYFNGHIIAISTDPDLCVLRIEYKRETIKIAKRNPDRGDKIYYAGYPEGMYSPGFLHFFEGYFAGIDGGRGAIWNFPVSNGSSGSAVLNKKGELIGIISAMLVDFHHVTLGASSEQIQQFMKETSDCQGFGFCLWK